MAYHRLTKPGSLGRRVRGRLLAPLIAATLFVTLLCCNAAQTLSVLLIPFSRSAFRRFNRWVAATWWGLCVLTARWIGGVRPVVTGDEIPMRENAIVVCNHQDMPDITLLMALARSRRRLGDLKFFVKHALKYVPGVGWGMVFLDCLFLRRRWSDDQTSIEATFSRLVRDRVPLWLVTFAEGTRFTPAKARASREYARKTGRIPLVHLLLPRTKGFVASVRGLRQNLDAVYDVTIGYPDGVPNLWQYVQGYVRVAHVHVRRYAIADLPTDSGALASWLLDLYREKDRLLAWFYRHGAFPPALHVIDGTGAPPQSHTGEDDDSFPTAEVG